VGLGVGVGSRRARVGMVLGGLALVLLPFRVRGGMRLGVVLGLLLRFGGLVVVVLPLRLRLLGAFRHRLLLLRRLVHDHASAQITAE
jgi:hypothetical protein